MRKLGIVKRGGETGEVDRGDVGRGIGSCPILENEIGGDCVECALAAPEFSTGSRGATCC